MIRRLTGWSSPTIIRCFAARCARPSPACLRSAEIAEAGSFDEVGEAARPRRRRRPRPARSHHAGRARLLRPDVSARAISERAGRRRLGQRRSGGDPPLHGVRRLRLHSEDARRRGHARRRSRACSRAASGRRPTSISRPAPTRRRAELMARLATLTPQQVRVLMMLSEGLLNKQIAYELSVSEATVKAHVSAILQKLGVESRTQAVIAAAKIEAGPVARQPRGQLNAVREPQSTPPRPRAARAIARAARAAPPASPACSAPGCRAARASSRTCGLRSAVIRIAGRSAPKRRRSCDDRVDAVAVVEVIVDQQAVGARLGFGQRRDGRSRDPAPCSTRQPQPPSSVSMPSRIFGSLSMHSTTHAGELPAIDALRLARARRRSAAPARAAPRPRNASRAPASSCRSTLWSSTRAMRSTIDSPRPEPARHPGALVEPVELAEDRAASSTAECRGRCRRRRCAGVRRAAGSRPARGPRACT